VTSTEEILAHVGGFNSTVPFTDEPTGFFGGLRELFDHLAAEEIAAGQFLDEDDPIPYPGFGSSTDDYETVVRPFYLRWAGFSSHKTFAWKDKYRLSDAPDRQVRRLMEKENKKCRDNAARDFNDAVRFLVAFARKRDPRYLPNRQTQAERQQAARALAAAQAAKARAERNEKLKDDHVPEWAQSRAGPREEADIDDEFSAGSEAGSEIEQIECVVCDKLFKSEKQYQAHERSRKHTKAVQQLRREMRRDGIELGLDVEEDEAVQTSGSGSKPEFGSASGSRADGENGPAKAGGRPSAPHPDDARLGDDDSPQGETSDEDYAQREAVERRLGLLSASRKLDTPNGVALESAVDELDLDGESASKRTGKAKAKRERRAARQAVSGAEGSAGITCSNCGQPFDSKNKLFQHLRQAHPSQQGPAKGTKKKKNK
jgi:DnaJ homolog subfamily A member 5